MTLSEEELAQFREGFDKNMFHILLPLLRSADITWDKPSGKILLSGEVFANCYIYSRSRMSIMLAKKFRQNNSIIVVDKSDYTLKIHDRHHVTFQNDDEYYLSGGLSGNNFIYGSKKRHAVFMSKDTGCMTMATTDQPVFDVQ